MYSLKATMEEADRRSFEGDVPDMNLSTLSVGTFVGWMAPRQRLYYLIETKDIPYTSWESFRDGMIHRWTNLNIVCGLIMGATTTIIFSEFELSAPTFAFGIISLLSSLMSIGFGVGLIYVLGDVRGDTLKVIATRHPTLYLFSLAIPQVWAGISFAAFFVYTCIIGWESLNKGPFLKIGIIITATILIAHLVGFVFLFRSQRDPELLIPEALPPRPMIFGMTSSAGRIASRATNLTVKTDEIIGRSKENYASKSGIPTNITESPIQEESREAPPFRHRTSGSVTLL